MQTNEHTRLCAGAEKRRSGSRRKILGKPDGACSIRETLQKTAMASEVDEKNSPKLDGRDSTDGDRTGDREWRSLTRTVRLRNNAQRTPRAERPPDRGSEHSVRAWGRAFDMRAWRLRRWPPEIPSADSIFEWYDRLPPRVQRAFFSQPDNL